MRRMISQGYRIEIERHAGKVTAVRDDIAVATSTKVNVLHETRLPDSYYFPMEAIDEKLLEPSDFRTFCPFKGTASYWHVTTPGGKIENGAWSYLNPLEESIAIGGQISFSREVVDRYDIEQSEPKKKVKSDGHINSALSDWVLREAGFCSTRHQLVGALGQKFVESGIAVYRMNITIWSLHPEIAGVNFRWRRDSGEVEISEPSYEVFNNPDYLRSPLNLVTRGLGGVRQPLNGDNEEFDFPIMNELKEEGATDYVAMPLRFSDGQFHSLTMACDHKDGFTTENLGLVFECVGVISRYFEVLTLRKNTTTLLDTYLGKRTGQKVLSGDIRRGQGENIEAVILFSDLRNSTKLAEILSRENYLEMLNLYFDSVLSPVNEYGGEVLKFIGDAVLAIFPISNIEDKSTQAAKALAAAQKIVENLSINDLEENSGSNEYGVMDLGISLHVGEVTYGNVGGQDRLDFTVIGPAVNLASRLESLCKSSGNRILLSQDFKRALGRDTNNLPSIISIGTHQFAGISDMQEVYAPN